MPWTLCAERYVCVGRTNARSIYWCLCRNRSRATSGAVCLPKWRTRTLRIRACATVRGARTSSRRGRSGRRASHVGSGIGSTVDGGLRRSRSGRSRISTTTKGRRPITRSSCRLVSPHILIYMSQYAYSDVFVFVQRVTGNVRSAAVATSSRLCMSTVGRCVRRVERARGGAHGNASTAGLNAQTRRIRTSSR